MRGKILFMLVSLMFSISSAQTALFRASEIPPYNNESYESILIQKYIKRYPQIQNIADLASLKIINNDYAIDKQHAYYGDKIIENADLSTFKAYKFGLTYDELAMDWQNVYLEGKIIPLASPQSFNLLSRDRFYAIDDQYVFYGHNIIRGADPDSFIVADQGHAQDKNYIFYQDKIIPNSDAQSFKFLNGDNQGYATDKNQAYYFPHILKGVHPNELIILSPRIAKDTHNIYINNNRSSIKIDVATFVVISKKNTFPEIFKDRFHVYSGSYGGIYTITDADTASFKLLPNDLTKFAKDKKYIFYIDHNGYQILENLPPEKTRLHGPFITDGEIIYNKLSSWSSAGKSNEGLAENRVPSYGFELVDIIDIPTFEYLAGNFAMDKDNVFRGSGASIKLLGPRSELNLQTLKDHNLININHQCFDPNGYEEKCP